MTALVTVATPELSTCPGCHGRARRELDKVECSTGVTFTSWVCGVCMGEGRIARDLAREVWRGTKASA